MGNANISSRIETTVANQGIASSFCKHTPSGFGYLPSLASFDPTHEDESPLYALLQPTQTEIDAAPRLRLCGEKEGLKSWGEAGGGGVSAQLGFVAHHYAGLEGNGQNQLGSRELGKGIAGPTSYEDYHHYIGGNILSVLENKGAEGSILAAISQAAVTGTNVAMALLSKGLPPALCVVPIIGNTGICMAFGAVIVLDDSFPTYIPVSKKLDLLDQREGQIASAYLFKATSHCKAIAKILKDYRQCSNDMNILSLNTDRYFVKRLTSTVFDRGLGLFENTDYCKNIQPGVFHMCDVLNLIYKSPSARKVIEFPLSIRTPDTNSDDCYEVIYRDITRFGFKMGCPDRILYPEVFESFKLALQVAVTQLHEAGVVHGDLYFSNVMWMLDNDGTSVHIKIVDWDAAHCLDEGKFVDKVYVRLVDYLGEDNVKFGVSHDLLYLSVLDTVVTEENENQWKCLASEYKAEIDEAYKNLLSSVLHP
jgi:hypothetical protein